MVRVAAHDQTIQLSEWYTQPWKRTEFLLPSYASCLLSFPPPQLSTIRQTEKDRIKNKYQPLGFPGGTSGKEPTCQCRTLKRNWEDPLEKAQQPTPVCLPGESHGQRSLEGYSPWGRTELGTAEETEHTRTYIILSNIFISNNQPCTSISHLSCLTQRTFF